ncbi:MAG: hypothetical protein LUE16_02715 [Lachnospiraceae bacterium]|nr:hypothetical protein [Lachnospiraceae bacterium]
MISWGDNGYVNQVVLQDNTIYMVTEHSTDNGYNDHFSSWDLEGNQLSDYEFYSYTWETYEEEDEAEVNGVVEDLDESEVNEVVEYLDESEVNETARETEDGETTDEETDGEIAEEETDLNEGSYISNYWISGDGTLYYWMEIYYYSDDWSYYEDHSYMVALQGDGTELFRINTADWGEEYEYIYFYSLSTTPEGNLALIGYAYVVTLDREGNLLSIVELDSSASTSSTSFTYNGMPVCRVWNEDWSSSSYMTMDVTTGELVEELELPDILNNYALYNGTNSGYDLIATGTSGVFGYNFGDEDVTKIMDFVSSDVPATSLSNVVFLSEDTLFGSYYDIVNYDQHFGVFTKVDPEDVPDKTEIQLAMYYTDSDILERVYDFNKTSDTYRVVVTYYSDYNTEGDEDAGITKLNNEIIAGDIPDIIYDYNGSYFDLDSYADLGILADIYELIEEDPELNLEDYCQNVFEAYETNGSLYQLPVRFRIRTVMGKTSIFGDEALTWEKLNEVMEEYPEASVFGTEYTRSDILYYAMMFSYGEFIDEENGTCDFTSEEFKSLLEFIAQYPDEIDYDALYSDDDYWENYDSMYVTDQVLLTIGYISNLQYVRYNYYYNFLEEASAVGFPNSSGVRGVIYAGESFAISKSGNVEGAWEFVRSFITEEVQMPEEGGYYYNIPILKAGVEALVNRMTEQSYYLDDNGEKVYYDYTVYVGNAEVVVEPATQEEAQKWLDFIYSVNTKSESAADEVTNIIFEEADAYFNGQKTVDEVCEIIQSRMSIYISENE